MNCSNLTMPSFDGLNFDLDQFFDKRLMRSKIANNPRLQPDHFTFDRQLGLKLIDECKHLEPQFAGAYTTFIEVFSSLRRHLDASGLCPENSREVAKSAIMYSLIEGQKVFNNLAVAIHRMPPPTVASTADMHNLRVIEGGDGKHYTGDELLRAIFESLKTILDYCTYLQGASKNGPDKGREYDLPKLFRIFNLFQIYKGDWEDCLWLNGAPDISASELGQNPAEIAWAIGLSRELSLNVQHLLHGNIISRKVAANHHFLSGKMNPTRKLKRDFEKFRSSMLNHVVYPFLSSILRRECDAKTRIARIVDLYLVLVFMSIGNMRKLSPTPPTESFVFSAAPFESYLEGLLSVERNMLLEALDWLTFKPGQRDDIWFTPLCFIEDHYVLLSPMIVEANFERFAEFVVARTGGFEIGKLFESYVVDRADAAVRNPILPKVHVLGPQIVEARSGREEIDLVLMVGTDVFVAEVKYDAFTADEISIHQHINKLRRACQQAKRKSEFLRNNWTVVSKKLGLAECAEEFFAFCITEKPFFSGFKLAGVPILALRDFEDFFVGKMHFNVTIKNDVVLSIGKTIKTFESSGSVGVDLRRYMRNCPRTEEFAKRLRLHEARREPNDIIQSKYSRLEFEVS